MGLINASPLAVPDQAGIEGAWQESLPPFTAALGTSFSRKTPGETYEQVLSAHFTLGTSAAAGTRTPLIVIQDSNGSNLEVVSPPAGQGPGLALNYTVDGQGHLQYALPLGGAVIGLPPLLLLPGYTFFIVIASMDPGDQIQAIGVTLLRIPTRAPQKPEQPLAVTPVAV